MNEDEMLLIRSNLKLIEHRAMEFAKLFDFNEILYDSSENNMIKDLTLSIDKFKKDITPLFEKILKINPQMEKILVEHYNFFRINFEIFFNEKVKNSNGFSFEPNDLELIEKKLYSGIVKFQEELNLDKTLHWIIL